VRTGSVCDLSSQLVSSRACSGAIRDGFRWAGYTLGYDIVGRYLTAHHLRASALVNAKAKKILAEFGTP